MEQKSGYFCDLKSAVSKKRYKEKVLAAGLGINPYSIQRWEEALETLPDVQWSDMIVYLTITPSEHTRYAVEVNHRYYILRNICG